MFKNLTLVILTFVFLFSSCNNDDDVKEISIDAQNTQDDDAIVALLKDYYFNSQTGKMIKFVNDDDSTTHDDEWDDAFTPIYNIATKLPSGVWYAKNPTVTEGTKTLTNVDTQEILVSYDLNYCISSVNSEGITTYKPMFAFITTLNSGVATWNNPFYLIKEDDMADGRTQDYYEIEGLQEGLKQFKTTDRTLADSPNYQGIVVVPSRWAFARDVNYLSTSLGLSSNAIMIFNFEMLDIRTLQ